MIPCQARPRGAAVMNNRAVDTWYKLGINLYQLPVNLQLQLRQPCGKNGGRGPCQSLEGHWINKNPCGLVIITVIRYIRSDK